jgi:DNA-binding IclR family transcriptional regulator
VNATVKSARRVIDIFEALAESRTGLTVSDLARRLAIPKSSTWLVARTLLECGYLERGPNGALLLGARLFDVGVCGRTDTRLQTLARPVLVRLMEKTSESVFLGILTPAFEVLYLDKVVSQQAIRYDADIGATRPAHCSSLGKALLAHLAPEQLARYLRGTRRQRFTDRTIVERAALREELSGVRQRGVAFAVDERIVGVSAITAPVQVRSGRAVAGVVVGGPTERILARREDLVPPIREAAAQIAEALGGDFPGSVPRLGDDGPQVSFAGGGDPAGGNGVSPGASRKPAARRRLTVRRNVRPRR